MIPKKLHRVAIGSVPEQFENYWNEWKELHPGWTFYSWESPIDPNQWQLGYRFSSIKSFSQLADFISLEAVYKHGGVYVDWDTQALKAIDPLLNETDCWFGSEDDRHFSHGIFGSIAGHPAIEACIKELESTSLDGEPNNTSGPGMLTKVLGVREDVTKLPKNYFYPISGSLYVEYAQINKELMIKKFPNSYTIHHWAHSWKEHGNRMSTYNTENLKDVLR